MKTGIMFARSFGGYHDADYAYEVVSTELARRGIATVEKATEPDAFLHLQGYDLLLIYSDQGEMTAEQEQALAAWLEAGGALVAIHGATASFSSSEEYHRLIGANFENHPPVMKFTVSRSNTDHMVTVRMPEAITVEDELYLLRAKADYQILMTARYLSQDVPITYVRQQGKGRIFYTALGHGRSTFDHPRVRDLICYGTRWGLGQQPRADVRVGLVGYGGQFGMGHLHGTLASGTPGMRLVAACDLNPKQMAVAQRDWPGIRTYTDPGALAEDAGVDFVVVIVPHHVHAGVAHQFLDAGKHVMVEKPFVIKAADARTLLEKAQAKNLTLTVFHNRRWDRDFMAVRQVVESGEIGTVYQFEAFLAGFGHPGYWWRSDKAISGGTMYDWGAHGTDWGLNLIADDVDYVVAWAQKRRWFDVSNEDAAKMVVHFKSGQLLDIEFGNLSAARKAYMRVLGTKGAIEVRPPYRDLNDRILIYRETDKGLAEELRPYKGQLSGLKHPWLEWSAADDLYRQLADHFLLGDPVPVTPESAARVIGVIEAATLSAQSGKPEAPTYW